MLSHVREKSLAGFETEEDVADEFRGEFVGFAGDGVRLVDEGRDLREAAGEQRRGGREATHAEDGVGLELPVDLFALAHAVPRACDEPDDRG